MWRRTAIGAVMLTAIAASGCATIFKGNTDQVTIATRPSGAYAWIDGAYVGQTPLRTGLDARHDHRIQLHMPGYEDVGVQLQPYVGVGWLVLDVAAFLVPVVVDALSGAWNHLGDVFVELEPGTERAPNAPQGTPQPPGPTPGGSVPPPPGSNPAAPVPAPPGAAPQEPVPPPPGTGADEPVPPPPGAGAVR